MGTHRVKPKSGLNKMGTHRVVVVDAVSPNTMSSWPFGVAVVFVAAHHSVAVGTQMLEHLVPRLKSFVAACAFVDAHDVWLIWCRRPRIVWWVVGLPFRTSLSRRWV